MMNPHASPEIPRLLALSTAVPSYVLEQNEVAASAKHIFGTVGTEISRLLPVFENAGIAKRHSCVPLEWYGRPHGWVERNRLYLENAGRLLERATLDCLGTAGLDVHDVDGIVAVSTTGIATPSLDALLIERLGLPRRVRRMPVFGLGCAGGVLGLGHAAALATARPGERILLLVVELCGLTFRSVDNSKSNIVATALFGDGAAAAIVSCRGDGPIITGWGEYTWPRSLDVMGWQIEEDGFGVLFSRDIPELIRSNYRAAAEGFLGSIGLRVEDIDHFICHPGGAKVILALEQALGLGTGALEHSRAVLCEYGNMSAASVMFVLERVRRVRSTGRYLLTALGPGFTAGFLAMEAS